MPADTALLERAVALPPLTPPRPRAAGRLALRPRPLFLPWATTLIDVAAADAAAQVGRRAATDDGRAGGQAEADQPAGAQAGGVAGGDVGRIRPAP